MEKLKDRLLTAVRASETLEELMLYENPSQITKDASLQRFEYTFEAVWKAAKQYLYDIEGIDLSSPKSVIRACFETRIFNEEEAIEALKMADDRNLTVHTYNESLSAAIYARLKIYSPLLRKWIIEMTKKVG